MEQRGLISWVILGIIFIIVLGLIVAGIYFYNFYVFKTVRICIGEATDTQILCTGVQECVDRAVQEDSAVNLDGAPDFIKDNFQRIVDESIFCNQTCFVRNVRGINRETQELEMLESCESGEVEIKMDIRGKEGIELLRWMRTLEGK